MTEFAQNTKEWLLWRTEGIGASDAPAIMGKSEYRTKRETWNEKYNKVIDESEPNFIQKKGHELEAWARAIYIEQTGYNYVPKNFVHKDFPFIRASMDGFCEFLWDGLEVKYMGKALFEKLRDETLTITERIPPQYFDQIMTQFFVTNCVAITLIGVCDTLEPNPDKPGKFKRLMFTLRIHNKMEFQTYIQNILAPELFSFWESVQKGIEPDAGADDYIELGSGELTPEQLKEADDLKVLLGQYAEMHEQQKAFEKKAELLRDKIKDHSARTHTRLSFGGFKLVLAAGSPSVKYKDALESFIAWIQSMKLAANDQQLINAVRNFPDVPNLEKFTEVKADSFKITIPKAKAKKSNLPIKTKSTEDEIEKVSKPKKKDLFNPEIELEEWKIMSLEEQTAQARLNTFIHPETGEQIKDWSTSPREEKIKKLIKIVKKISNDADRVELNNFAVYMEKLDKEIKLKLAHKKAQLKDKPKTISEEILEVAENALKGSESEIKIDSVKTEYVIDDNHMLAEKPKENVIYFRPESEILKNGKPPAPF